MADAKIDARLVARAAAGVAARVAAGVSLGVVIGVAAFVIAQRQGWLGTDPGRWVMLPVDIVVGAVALGWMGLVRGKRRAAKLLLIDSGLVARLTRRALVGDRTEGTDAGSSALVRWARSLGQRVIGVALTRTDGTGDPVAQVTDRVTETIDDWGSVGATIAAVVLVVVLAGPPLLVAVTGG